MVFLVGDFSYHGCRAACSHVYLLFGSFSIRFRMKSFAVHKKAQGVESVFGLWCDNLMPPGPWEYCMACEKQTSPLPLPLTLLCTLDTGGNQRLGESEAKTWHSWEVTQWMRRQPSQAWDPAFPTQSPSLWQLVTSLVQRSNIFVIMCLSLSSPLPRQLLCGCPLCVSDITDSTKHPRPLPKSPGSGQALWTCSLQGAPSQPT